LVSVIPHSNKKGMMNLLKYFDLNRRVAKKTNRQRGETKVALIQQWSLFNPEENADKRRQNLFIKLISVLTQHEEGQLSIADQLLMYFGVLLGVYFSGVIRDQDFRPTLFLASVVALIIIPAAFEKLNINPTAPLIVRFGLFVQNGVFWDVFLQAIGTGLRSR
jgi:hypothetical protein